MDVASMAETIRSAASAAPPSAEPVASTPAIPELPASSAPAVSEPTPAAEAPAPVAGEALQFDDEPAELNFDDDPEPPSPAYVAEPHQPAKRPPISDDEAAVKVAEALKAGGIPKPIEDAFLQTQRGRHMLAAFKADRVLREPPNFDPTTGENTGGLGYMPTPQQIKEYHQGHADWNASVQEYAANPQSWATNWFGPNSQGQFRDGVGQVLASIPQVIDQAFSHAEATGNAQLKDQAIGLYRTVFAPMLSSYLDGFYEKARAIADPAQREQYINAARAIEADMFGKFREDGQLAPPKPEDIATARMRELDEREARLKAWDTKNITTAQKAVETEIFSSIDQNLTRDCEKALGGVKVAMSERAFRAAVNDFKREVQDAVRKNQIGWRDFNFKLSAARTNRGADARTAPVQTYRQTAQQVIQARYRTVLQELATDATRQNGALHATAAAAAAQTAPAVNGGQAPPQSLVPDVKITRRAGEENVQYFKRAIAERLGSPN